MPRPLAVLFVVLLPGAALALTPVQQTMPERGAILRDGDVHLYTDLGVSIDEPASRPDVGNSVRLPIGVDIGFGNFAELGGVVDLGARPEIDSVWSLRMRFAPWPWKWVAAGLGLTLPLGMATSRLGPDGMPFYLEVPVVRIEKARAAFQSTLRWDFGVYRDIDFQKSLELALAGVVRWNRYWFALLDISNRAPNYDPEFDVVAMALGVGFQPREPMWIKLQAQTPDLVDMTHWTALITFVYRWDDPLERQLPPS